MAVHESVTEERKSQLASIIGLGEIWRFMSTSEEREREQLARLNVMSEEQRASEPRRKKVT